MRVCGPMPALRLKTVSSGAAAQVGAVGDDPISGLRTDGILHSVGMPSSSTASRDGQRLLGKPRDAASESRALNLNGPYGHGEPLPKFRRGPLSIRSDGRQWDRNHDQLYHDNRDQLLTGNRMSSAEPTFFGRMTSTHDAAPVNPRGTPRKSANPQRYRRPETRQMVSLEEEDLSVDEELMQRLENDMKDSEEENSEEEESPSLSPNGKEETVDLTTEPSSLNNVQQPYTHFDTMDLDELRNQVQINVQGGKSNTEEINALRQRISLVEGENAKLVSWFTVGVQKIIFKYFNLFNAKKIGSAIGHDGHDKGRNKQQYKFC